MRGVSQLFTTPTYGPSGPSRRLRKWPVLGVLALPTPKGLLLPFRAGGISSVAW